MNSKNWTRSEKYAWTFILTLGCTLVYATRMAVPVTISKLSAEFGWSKTTSGGILSSFLWGYSFTQILGGYFADRFGGSFVIWMSGVMWTILTLIVPYIPIFINPSTSPSTMLNVFLVSRILFGFTQGIHFPATSNLISSNLHVDEKTFVSGIVYSGGSFGIVLCGFISSIFLESYGWQSIFTITGLLSIFWLMILRHMSGKSNLKMTESLPSSNLENFSTKSFPWSVFRHKAFWAMICAHIAHDNSWYIIVSWLPTFFQEMYPESPTWLFNSMPFVLSPVVSITSASISENMNQRGYSVTYIRKFMHSICQLLIIIPLFIVGRIHDFVFSIILVCIAIGGASIHSACLSVNPQDLAPEFAGSLFGLMNTASAIPGFVGVYFAGYIQQATGHWSSVFDMTASINFIGMMIFVIFGSGKPIIKPEFNNKSVQLT